MSRRSATFRHALAYVPRRSNGCSALPTDLRAFDRNKLGKQVVTGMTSAKQICSTPSRLLSPPVVEITGNCSGNLASLAKKHTDKYFNKKTDSQVRGYDVSLSGIPSFLLLMKLSTSRGLAKSNSSIHGCARPNPIVSRGHCRR